jgi:ATP-dependent DNA helicase RecG
MNLSSSVELIKGVGKETAKKLQKLGIVTVYDLLTYWPRKYDDYSEVKTISQISGGTVTIKAKVENIKTRRVRRGLHITEANLRDETGAIKAVWFNQPYRKDYFQKPSYTRTDLESRSVLDERGGEREYYFSGLYEFSYNRYSLMNPTVEEVSEFTKNTARIVPVYRETKGITSREIRALLHECIHLFDELEEILPKVVIKKNKLISYARAAKQMHWPENQEKLKEARYRVGFEEIFSYVLAGQLNKQEIENEAALKIIFDEKKAKEYVQLLPFDLTPAQKKAAWEILQDIARTIPMNRLLEGDVGAGKTVVAAFGAVMAAHSGVQSAFMAPTEILARQHAQTLADLLENTSLKVGLLVSGIKKPQKEKLKEQLSVGNLDIVVGTHALLQEDVEFKKLGYIVIDEQHRFGVAQRQKLVDKGIAIPHILSMTATPIPRSLALTVYGELDISIINQKPSNRLPIKTHIWSPNSRSQLYDEIDREIVKGRQVFVVCPLIDESDKTGIKSVTEELKILSTGPFKHRRIGLLHGKLKEDEKVKVMEDFANQKLDILVSTTVIEVGIDVPNASVMLIEAADQFGLAQLHQLRGRVGRAEHQSYCYLMMSTSQKPTKRLRAMESTNNGFKLAEMDLELRGPGALYGMRQHGKLDLKIAQITDTKLIKAAKTSADAFLKSSERLTDYPVLHQRVQQSRSLTYLN